MGILVQWCRVRNRIQSCCWIAPSHQWSIEQHGESLLIQIILIQAYSIRMEWTRWSFQRNRWWWWWWIHNVIGRPQQRWNAARNSCCRCRRRGGLHWRQFLLVYAWLKLRRAPELIYSRRAIRARRAKKPLCSTACNYNAKNFIARQISRKLQSGPQYPRGADLEMLLIKEDLTIVVWLLAAFS